MQACFVGVDVGTASARAGVFNEEGRLLGSAKRPIRIWHEPGSIVEQSANQIWQAVAESVREAVAQAAVPAAAIKGVGFDATCSLVAVRSDGSPVSVSPSGDPERNIIVWMDHRAAEEAAEINARGHAVLRYVGGRISPEMETPKLLWLKRHLPGSYAATDHFFDLADYLTWRSTGSTLRSLCTVTCKWTYLAHENRWDEDYFRSVGLDELTENVFARIGSQTAVPGTPLGEGLAAAAAADLGLEPGTAVASALIDAHAGGVGTLGGRLGGLEDGIEKRLAYIFGTSACSMASSAEPAFVDGVWGPYFSAMVPGLWLTEGGQSAAGAAIDHLVTLHPAHARAVEAADSEGLGLIAWLDQRAQAAVEDLHQLGDLAGGLHVVPEFLGNRSPFADPDSRAVIAGFGLEDGLDHLVSLYVAGLCGIAYGLRQLLERLEARGMAIELVVASGGAARSALVRQLLADAVGKAVAIAETEEPVLLGAAMLGAVASGHQPGLREAMSSMSRLKDVARPASGPVRALHDRRFRAFEHLQAAARAIRDF
jgi:FGGY-family pentulose kinase